MVELELATPAVSRARHFLCADSGMVFFGNDEALNVCRHVDEDLAEKYVRVPYRTFILSKGESE